MSHLLLDITLAFLPIVVAEVVGFSLGCLVARSSFGTLSRGYVLALAFGLGTGALSIVHFLWILIPGASFAGMTADLVVAGLLVLAVLVRRPLVPVMKGPTVTTSHPERWAGAALTWLCVANVALAIGVVAGKMAVLPLGTADAVTNWNLKARYIFLGAQNWSNMDSPLLPRWIHADYPLLLPLTVARSWSYLGRTAAAGPVLQHTAIFAASLGLLYFAVRSTHGRIPAAVAVLLLLSMPATFFWASLQYADIFMMFFVTAAMTLYHLYRSGGGGRFDLLTLVGVALGLGAWTKNEGWVILVVVVVARLTQFALGSGCRLVAAEARRFWWGLLPTLSVPLLFKLICAPADDVMAAAFNSNVLERVLDLARLRLILSHTSRLMFDTGNWGLTPFFCISLLAVSAGRLRGRWMNEALPVQIIVLVVLAYTLSYLVTPHNLSWHLRFSQDRLFLQLSPSVILLVVSVAFAQKRPVAS
jgi:hypothetical protein